MKNKITENKAFFNKLAKNYDDLFGNYIKKMQLKLINHVNIKNNSNVLDVGCGTGNFLKILEDSNKNLNLYGIDISEKMLKIAKNKLKNTKLFINQAEKINSKEKFDYIFTTDAFHHLSNREMFVKKSYKALKKQGTIIIADLSFGKFLNYIFSKIEPGNTGILSPEQIKQLLIKNKFKSIKQKKVGLFTFMTIGKKL